MEARPACAQMLHCLVVCLFVIIIIEITNYCSAQPTSVCIMSNEYHYVVM